MIRKSIIGVSAIAAMLAFNVVSTPFAAAMSTSSAQTSASRILYKCRKYSWFIGWRTEYTYDWQYYVANGWTCYCVA